MNRLSPEDVRKSGNGTGTRNANGNDGRGKDMRAANQNHTPVFEENEDSDGDYQDDDTHHDTIDPHADADADVHTPQPHHSLFADEDRSFDEDIYDELDTDMNDLLNDPANHPDRFNDSQFTQYNNITNRRHNTNDGYHDDDDEDEVDVNLNDSISLEDASHIPRKTSPNNIPAANTGPNNGSRPYAPVLDSDDVNYHALQKIRDAELYHSERELQTFESRLRASDEQIAQLQNSLKESDEREHSLHSRLEAQAALVERLIKDISELRELSNDQQVELQKRAQDSAELQAQLHVEAERHREEKLALEHQLSLAKQNHQNSLYSPEVLSHDDDSAQLHQIQDLQSRLSESEQNRKRLEMEWGDMRSSLEDSERRMTGIFELRLQEEKCRVAAADTARTRLDVELAESRKEILRMARKEEELYAETLDVQRQLNNMQNMQANARTDVTRAEEALKQVQLRLQDERQQFKERLDTERDEFRMRLEDERKQLQLRMDEEVRHFRQQIEDERRQANMRLEEERNNTKSLQMEVNQFQQQLASSSGVMGELQALRAEKMEWARARAGMESQRNAIIDQLNRFANSKLKLQKSGIDESRISRITDFSVR